METETILTKRTITPNFICDPLTRKIYLELPAPGLEDNQTDMDRLHRALGEVGGYERVSIPLELMRIIPSVCREAGWRVTASVGKGQSRLEIS